MTVNIQIKARREILVADLNASGQVLNVIDGLGGGGPPLYVDRKSIYIPHPRFLIKNSPPGKPTKTKGRASIGHFSS